MNNLIALSTLEFVDDESKYSVIAGTRFSPSDEMLDDLDGHVRDFNPETDSHLVMNAGVRQTPLVAQTVEIDKLPVGVPQAANAQRDAINAKIAADKLTASGEGGDDV